MRKWQRSALLHLHVALAVVGIGSSTPGIASELSPLQVRQVRGELVTFRRVRSEDARIRIASKVAEMGPAACAMLADMFKTELERAERNLSQSQLDPRWQKRVDQLRETMRGLRADPELSKEKIKEVGDPAFEELQELFASNRAAIIGRRRALTDLSLQLHSQRSFLDRLEKDDASPSAPKLLDALKDQSHRIDQLLDKHDEDPDVRLHEMTLDNLKRANGVDREAVNGMQQLNELRDMLGVPFLTVDPLLCEAAAEHSSDMAKHDFFSHESTVSGKRTFLDRAKLAGTTASAENIFIGSRESRSALKAWYYSPPHHKNMFNSKHSRLGLGQHSKRWTLMLGGR